MHGLLIFDGKVLFMHPFSAGFSKGFIGNREAPSITVKPYTHKKDAGTVVLHLSLSRNPVAGQAATGFLVVIKIKTRSSKGKWEFVHFHFANFLRFMAANLSFTQFVT